MYSIPVMSSIQINVYNKYKHYQTEIAFEDIYEFCICMEPNNINAISIK